MRGRHEDETALTLQALLLEAFTAAHLWEPEERKEVARAVAQSITAGVLEELMEQSATRVLGERVQEAIVRHPDLLIAAGMQGFTKEDAFAEAFGNVFARVIDDVIEVSEADDAHALRRRLHAAVLARMREAAA